MNTIYRRIGSRNPNVLLTAEAVYEIRTAGPEVSRKALAARYKCSPSAVTAARQGKTWKWLAVPTVDRHQSPPWHIVGAAV